MKKLETIHEIKGKAAAVFSLKDRVVGSKKTPQEQVVIIDPKTGNEATDPKEIKRISLEFCLNLLKTMEPKEKYAGIIAKKRELHEERMSEIV